MKHSIIFAFFLIAVCQTYCGRDQIAKNKPVDNSKNKANPVSKWPKSITRNIIQDRKGNIWIAAFDGIFRYDGKSFINVTSKMSSARFFSVLEDRKGNLWFGSLGEGAYRYDGKSFQNFTTKEGLLNNAVGAIYEDKIGNIWFGVSGGASRYNGRSFQNYIIDEDMMKEDHTGTIFPNGRKYEITSVIQDKNGSFWLASRNNAFIYDGKNFTTLMHNGRPFKNVRSLLKDKKDNIWLGGADGLWRYNGTTFVQLTQRFVGHIIEDKKGNIWTSSGRNSYKGWALSRYDVNSLTHQNPMSTVIVNKPMTFGILEDDKGNIWFGDFEGVHRYDGKTITDFNNSTIPQVYTNNF